MQHFSRFLILAVVVAASVPCLADDRDQAHSIDQPAAVSAELLSVNKIWSEGQHNGFPDLVRFQDRWFCCLREGERHVGGEDGKIRIITSTDGDNWESAALLEEKGADLRDACLSEMPDGRLMLVCGASYFDDVINNGKVVQHNGQFVSRESRVAFSQDGRTWTKPRKILDDDMWLWRVTWHKGTAYGLAKMGHDAGKDREAQPRRGLLFSSTDGLAWKQIVEWGPPVAGSVSETRLRFTDDDEMIAVIRPRFIGFSRPPYREWTFHRSEAALMGPNLQILTDGSLLAATRHYIQATEADLARSKKPHAARTVLASIDRQGHFDVVLELPSGGDTGYTGLVWHDDLLYMVYYSSHEKTSIYLAKIKVTVP